MNCANEEHGILKRGSYKNVFAYIKGIGIVIALCKDCYDVYLNDEIDFDNLKESS